MTEIIVTLCEGQDDISFLSRILYVNGFKKYNNKLKNFIKPFNNLFLQKLKEKEIDRFRFIPANHLVPSVVLLKDEKYIFFHNLGGDGRHTEIKNILEMYNGLISDEDDWSSYDFKYKFLLFFDADKKGIKKREEEISELLGKELSHNKIEENYGLYIFNKSGFGTLEDILLEIMEKENKSIFNNAKEYIQRNKFEDENRCKEFVCSNVEEKHKGNSKFYEKKSIISVAGQLQFSAKSNSVIIEKSDYIKKKDIETNNTCKEIIELFLKD
jgi:hypothetical protein